jgi:predicted esterase
MHGARRARARWVSRAVAFACLAACDSGGDDGAAASAAPVPIGGAAANAGTTGAPGSGASGAMPTGASGMPAPDVGAGGAMPVPPVTEAGMGGSAGAGGGMATPDGPTPTKLPAATEACPTLAPGDVTLLGKRVHLWMDMAATEAADGPLLIYWHGTGSNPVFEAPVGLGPGVDATVAAGGIVAGFYSEACMGCRTTGNNVWYHEDFARADELVACAIEQVGIDTRRIHTAGMSAGGLQASAMVYTRSNYLASATSYSGGIIPIFSDTMPQDPANKLAVMIVHGGPTDQVVIKFQDASNMFKADLVSKGHFAFICDHGMGHTIPMGINVSTWQFFQDHPYGTDPPPYASALPAGFPSYCTL